MKKNNRRVVSLERALSKLGYCSRIQAASLVKAGRVSVNNRIVTSPSFRCSPGEDNIAVDGEKIRDKKCVYLVMNKPVGIVTTRSDERGRKTVYDILGDVGEWIFPVGRLDKDTSGLLLFTNDNRFGERMTHPTFAIPKTYRVRLNKPILPEHERAFRQGMTLEGDKLLPASVRASESFPFSPGHGQKVARGSACADERIPGCWIEMTIFEGKNRQVRRMCESVGYKVLELIRVKIGGYELANLKPGEWKKLAKHELDLLTAGTSSHNSKVKSKN